MNESKILAVYGHLQEAEQKLDYFIVGVAGALCAFIAQSYRPEQLGLNPSTLEVVSVFSLLLSCVLGFRRIELSIIIGRINALMLESDDKLSALVSNFNGASLLNKSTGEVYTPETTLMLIEKYGKDKKSLLASLNMIQKKSQRAYRARNWLLPIGLLFLLSSRISVPYMNIDSKQSVEQGVAPYVAQGAPSGER